MADIASICWEVRHNPRKKGCEDCPFMDKKFFPGEHEGCHFRREPYRFDSSSISAKIKNYDILEEQRKIEEEKRNRSFTFKEVRKMLTRCIERSGQTGDWLDYIDEIDANERTRRKVNERIGKENTTPDS